jgi:hypothetical protein
LSQEEVAAVDLTTISELVAAVPEDWAIGRVGNTGGSWISPRGPWCLSWSVLVGEVDAVNAPPMMVCLVRMVKGRPSQRLTLLVEAAGLDGVGQGVAVDRGAELRETVNKQAEQGRQVKATTEAALQVLLLVAVAVAGRGPREAATTETPVVQVGADVRSPWALQPRTRSEDQGETD